MLNLHASLTSILPLVSSLFSMKRTRKSAAAGSKPPPPKKGSRGQSGATAKGDDGLGVTEAQLGRIAEQVGQRLAQTVAAEVVTALTMTKPTSALGAATPAGASATVEVQEGPQPQEKTVAESAVCALLYGESAPKTNPSCSTSTTPLAYHVPDKLQEKVRAGKYVEFRQLLPGGGDTSYTLRLDSGKGDPSVHLASTTPAKPIASMDAWLSAYTNFQYIYLQANPTSAPDLLKYQDTVRDLHQRFGFQAAKYYDENFRLLRERLPDLSFGSTHSELWLKAATLQAPPRTNQPFLGRSGSPRARSSGRPAGKGCCFDYNTPGKRCIVNPCPYKHACTQCQGNHPQYFCRPSGPQQAAQSNTRTPRSTPTPSTAPHAGKSH